MSGIMEDFKSERLMEQWHSDYLSLFPDFKHEMKNSKYVNCKAIKVKNNDENNP